MKRIALLMISVILVASVFVSCTGSKEPVSPTNESGETTYPQSSEVLYDRNGDSYSEKSKVKYFDKAGNVYYFKMDQETYLPSFVNEKGESIDGFFCYISEDGYLVHDTEHKIKLNDGSADTYSDEKGNTYYDISTVEWDKDGNLVKTKQ